MSDGVDECDDNGDGDDICVEVNPPLRERVKHEKMPNGPFSPKYAPSPSTKYAPRGRRPPLYSQYTMPRNNVSDTILVRIRSYTFPLTIKCPIAEMLKFASTSILSSQFLCSASTYRANSIHLVDLCMLNTTSILQTKNEQPPQQSNVHRCYYFHSCIYYIYLRERADTPNPQYSTSPGTFSPSQREICSTFTFTEIYAFSLSHFHFSRYFFI